MKRFIIIALFTSLLLGSTAIAQDTVLVKEVTVSQEFNPTVNDAFKINTVPEADEPISYTPSFEYSFFNAPLKTTYDIQHIEADRFKMKNPAPLGDQNYIKGGIGNYTTLLGELFYNAYNSDNQTVNIFYHNRSSWGDVRLQDDKMVDAPRFVNYGKIDFQQRNRRSIFNTSFVFDRLGYKYYGYNTMNSTDTYEYLDDKSSVVSEVGSQSITNITFDANLASLTKRASDLQYLIDFAINSASNEDRFRESQFDLAASLKKGLDKLSVGADATTFVGFYNNAQLDSMPSYFGDTYFGVGLSPFVQVKKKGWDLKIGVNLDYYSMNTISEFNVSPLIDFNFNIVPKYFVGFVKTTGDLNPNTYSSVMKENPFVANDIIRDVTKTPLDISLGIVGNPTKSLSFKLEGQYQMIKNQMYYVNEFVESTTTGQLFVTEAYTNRFVAEYDDLNVLTFHSEVSYNSHKKWSASAAADFNYYDTNYLAEAWNLPELQISAFGHYDVTDKIRLKASFMFLPTRAVKVSSTNAVEYLPVVYDFSLNGEYKFSNNLSFFLDINNIAASKYYMYNGYPSYRFNALAGAVFRF